MSNYKKFFSFVIIIFSSFHSFAEYFQQEVNFTIHVSLNDNTHELSAFEQIIYKNNSDSTLNVIYFHLWPAAYQNRNTVLAQEIFKSGDDRMLSAETEDLGTIDSIDFNVNGEKVKWKILDDTLDVCKVNLNKPLKPGVSISITTPFHVKIPSAYLSRLGHDGQAYFITQWFPKPAVFDKNGWNYFPYLDQGEYYSEFGSFDVFITAPDNYKIAATGTMINEEKEIEWLNNLDSITRTIKNYPAEELNPPSSTTLKTLHFHQDKIHDFAWFADKRWYVLKEKIQLPGNKSKSVVAWAFFNNREAEYWLRSPEYMRNAVNYYSDLVGEYPYDKISMVDVGDAMGSAMEYPMISTIGNYGDPFELEITIFHEIGHNWFFGALGSNERKHVWLDEGINNFYETRYVYSKYVTDSSYQKELSIFNMSQLVRINHKINHRERQYNKFLAIARINRDQSSDERSEKLSITNYHGDGYYKASMSFDYLKDYLGDSLFDTCMRSYFNEWKFRHPEPEDLKNVFEKTSGKNLDWLFKGLLKSNAKLDYKIVSLQSNESSEKVLKIQNAADIQGPFKIQGSNKDQIIASKWVEGFSGEKNIDFICESCDNFRIDPQGRMPELYQGNNFYHTKGILKRTSCLKFIPGFQIDNSRDDLLRYSPIVGWNNYNQLMAGGVLHNVTPFEKKLEFALAPLFAFGTTDLAGGANVSYHLYPANSRINRIEIKSGLSRYAFADDFYESPDKSFSYNNTLHFLKSDTRIKLSILQNDRQEQIKNTLMIRSIIINRDIPYFFNYKKTNKILLYWQLEYKRENLNPLNFALQKISLTANKDFLNISGEIQNFLTYGKIKKGFGIRLFAGYLDIANSSSGFDYRMSLSGKTGSDDYLFDEVFLARTDYKGILSHQFINDYAGFKTPTLFYRLAEQWMFGFNTTTTLPGIIPFRLFANIGIFDHSDNNGEYGKVSWEAGIDLPVIKDIFVISLPFAYSKDIKYVIDNEKLKTGDLIRFELHLNLLNPLELIKNIYTD